MQHLKIAMILLLLSTSISVAAQKGFSFDEVNAKSYTLYQQAAWTDLLSYGKEAVENGQDFSLLRQRMAYAAFMLSNFSEAILQYEKVLKSDSYNSIAHYYIWMCRKYLNQSELAGRQIKYLSPEIIAQQKLEAFAFTGAGFETSYKTTDSISRGNTFYQQANVQTRISNNLHWDQAISFFNQAIKTPNTATPSPNAPLRNVSINQKEYYSKLTYNIADNWQLKGAYHYTYTGFDAAIYNNHTGFIGLKYIGNYLDAQVDALFSTISDSSINQFDFQLGVYPLGNMNLYGISTATARNRPSGSAFNFRQIIGCKLQKSIWIEGNITLGSFTDLLENDGMYIYNAIDQNLFKGGVISYISLSPKCTLEIGYTLEQREIKTRKTTFNQHSITGGLSWKF